MKPLFPDVKVKLVGEDGNIFFIMGRVGNALKRAGHDSAVKRFYEEVTTSGSYDDALQVVMKYVKTY